MRVVASHKGSLVLLLSAFRYKMAKRTMKEKQIELDRMQAVGATAANIGGKDDIKMEKSP